MYVYIIYIYIYIHNMCTIRVDTLHLKFVWNLLKRTPNQIILTFGDWGHAVHDSHLCSMADLLDR